MTIRPETRDLIYLALFFLLLTVLLLSLNPN